MIEREVVEKNKILKIVVGSQLYGTNTPDSDEDYSGIFIAPEDYYFGIRTSDERDLSTEDKNELGKNTADAVDYKLYEIRNLVRLAAQNNPNIIEHLFVNDKNILHITEHGRHLLNHAYLFPNKSALDKFIGYAKSQKHKMIIKLDNYEQLTNAKEFFSNQDPNEYIVMFREDDRVKEFFAEKGSYFIVGDLNFQKHMMVKKVLAALNERLDKIKNRHELVLKYGYDTKFASHLIRLLTECRTLLKYGKLEFPLYNADFILQIKQGKFELEKILEMSDEYEAKLQIAHDESHLPKFVDIDEVNNLTKTITKNFFGVK